MTPMQAIRAKCLDCSAGQANEVRLCPVTGCALYPFRFGKNPNNSRECTPAQLEALRNGRKSFLSVDNIEEKTANPPAEGNLRPR